MLFLVIAGACAYPRRETLTYPAPPLAEGNTLDAPSGLWSFRLIGAELPPFKGGGLPWDTDGTPPDPYLRLILGDRVVFESAVRENTLRPQWDVTLPRNLYVSGSTRFRIEVWDHDSASSDPAGSVTRSGMPDRALPNAAARLPLDNLGAVTIMVAPPRPSRGVGLRFEIHSDALVLLDVEPFSPAARAGLKAGDRIVAIGGTRVEALGGDQAATQLSLAADRGTELTVSDGKRERAAAVDRGYLWLSM